VSEKVGLAEGGSNTNISNVTVNIAMPAGIQEFDEILN